MHGENKAKDEQQEFERAVLFHETFFLSGIKKGFVRRVKEHI